MNEPTCEYDGESLTAGYHRHRSNGEQACAECLARWNEYSRRSRERNPRNDRRHEITCAHCGAQAMVTKATAECCSKSCAQRMSAGWSTSTELVHVGPTERPRWSTRPDVDRTDWWQFVVHGPCALCGDIFTGLAASPAAAPMFCSNRCARKASKDRRRARKAGGFVANVSRRRIFERDRWTCQICRKPVARTKVVPHPRAPVLDHIIPLAKDGTHEPRNVQCAHFLCNSRKSDGGTDQLRLIG